ncbi:hypothetical protein ACLB2K_066460 [Fragaria x ananassa]
MGRGGAVMVMKRAEEGSIAYLAPPDKKKLDEVEAKLYVCTYEFHFGYVNEFNRYHVHAIKLSDLFSFDLTLIPMFSSQSNFVIQQVVVLEGEDLPINMGIGVFGSRIVLASGTYECREVLHAQTYVLETDQSVEPNPSFISSRCIPLRKPNRPPYVIPGLKG